MPDTCSICRSPIQPGEAAATCIACEIPYHAECWAANMGCATYGCKQVNCLAGPRTRVEVPASTSSAPSQAPRSVQTGLVWHCAIGSEMHGPWNTAQVQQWVRDHNASMVAKVWKSGWPQWRPIAEVREFCEPRELPSPTQHPSNTAPLFLHISIARLIAMSIASFGLYEAYWIYKNWRYIKERDHLNIRPFWRGWYGIFYCHQLLRRIHEDVDARAVELPTFTPGRLATGWVILIVTSYVISRQPGIVASMLSAFIPSFLCLVPVQNYVNRVNRKRVPSQQYAGWSAGHVVCLVFGIVVWVLLLVGLGAEN